MKTILITGTSSGIGKAISKYFSEKGWNVIATMRSPEKELELTKLEKAFVTKLDVEQEETIKEAIAKGIDHFGKIDVVVNNAGYGTHGIFEAVTNQQIQRQFSVNVFGLMKVTKAILPHFRTNKAGLIINISSMGGRLTIPTMSLYHSTKFAVEGFSEALTYELASQNIHIKLVEPGYIRTDFTGRSMDYYFDDSLTDYKEFVDAYRAAQKRMMSGPDRGGAPEMVAEVVYQAATDGSEQLRYPVGEDALTYANLKAESGDEAYLHYISEMYGLPVKRQI